MTLVELAAKARGFDPHTIAAIVEVESGPLGAFGADGRPIILYEPHVAYRVASPSQRRMLVDAGIAYAKWKRGSYPPSQAARWEQFHLCVNLAGRDVAVQACSWGLGQVLGENWRLCGYASPAEFEEAQAAEIGQIETMLRFLEGHDLSGAVAARDWRRIARTYNGPGQVDLYAGRMEAAYRRLTGERSPVILRAGAQGDAVRKLQRALGENPDGKFGPRTEAAVIAFQRDAGLTPDGVVGAKTWTALYRDGVTATAPPAQPVPTPAADGAELVGKVAAGAGGLAAAIRGLRDVADETSGLFTGVDPLILAGLAVAGLALIAGAYLLRRPGAAR